MTDLTTSDAAADARIRPGVAIAEARESLTVAIRVAVVTAIVAGLIHYAVVPEHRAEWWLYAVFFTLLGAFELGWAAMIWTGADRWLLVLGVVVNIAVIVLWTVTRTTGLPFGPEPGEPEAVGLADAICVAAEVATVVASALALRRQRQQAR